jgi:plastocyanin
MLIPNLTSVNHHYLFLSISNVLLLKKFVNLVLMIILYTVLLLAMIPTKHNMSFIATGTTSMMLVSLAISFAGISPSEIFAQGTNATNATSGAANATGAAGGQTTIVMPLGSSAPNSNLGYEPREATISPGATVIWDNQDNALHTATSGQSPNPDGKFDTSYVAAGQSSKPVTMPTQPGEYPYFCTLHPFLTGTVVVQ